MGGSATAPTGVLLEVDLQAVGRWLKETAELANQESDEISSRNPFSSMDLDDEDLGPTAARLEAGLERMQRFRYHHRMESGRPRSSYHLQLTPRP